jgi:hypothetical protein
MRDTNGKSKWQADQGFLFGADMVAEHELGIEYLARKFGVYENVGPTPIHPQKLPAEFGSQTVTVDGGECVLLSSDIEHGLDTLRRGELRFWSLKGEQNTAAAWSQLDFAILCRGSDVDKLRQLEQAFEEQRVLFSVRERSAADEGLVLSVTSTVAK